MATAKTKTKPAATRRDDVAISFRVSSELAEALDKEVERMQGQNPGLRVTRSEAARVLLHKALMGGKS